MREIGYRDDRRLSGPPQYERPKDAKKYGETTSYEVYTSKKEGAVFVEWTEYHAGNLRLEAEDLRKLLRKLGR